jgi:hypothetical protein
MTPKIFLAFALLSLAILKPALSGDESGKNTDPDLAADLKLLQGSWELLHGNEGKGAPTIRSVKTIEGNTETLRRYSVETGTLTHEHSVDIALSKSGNVRVLTFNSAGAPGEYGLSYIYKVDEEHFYDIPGMLHGKEFRNYQKEPTIWHWRRVKNSEEPSSKKESAVKSPPAEK